MTIQPTPPCSSTQPLSNFYRPDFSDFLEGPSTATSPSRLSALGTGEGTGRRSSEGKPIESALLDEPVPCPLPTSSSDSSLSSIQDRRSAARVLPASLIQSASRRRKAVASGLYPPDGVPGSSRNENRALSFRQQRNGDRNREWGVGETTVRRVHSSASIGSQAPSSTQERDLVRQGVLQALSGEESLSDGQNISLFPRLIGCAGGGDEMWRSCIDVVGERDGLKRKKWS